MPNPYTRAPHQGGIGQGASEAPHAGLLIDFDNVTMGMRSDLSKELKTLLESDIIKGKVSVQRAYADWRRYPQYIVPLSEASVDLIFAPAYGSNKKNATDIRMAIDAVELVFIRPEIGTFILLTGDSDFSSLVLKLKEYGKYVIGVGIQESTSDILVQNCDEYYSYTSLTGLKKTTEADHKTQDPWVLVKDALKKMMDRNDVMRSDRLKQVMQEIDPSFDEGGLGFSKFSKFLAEASSRGLIGLHKLDNGQYEVGPAKGRGRGQDGGSRDARRERRGRGERPDREPRGGGSAHRSDAPAKTEPAGDDPLAKAYALLTRTLGELREAGRDPVRDSDVKRKMLDLDRSFDEAELGFSKFSRFLGQAADHSVVRLVQTDAGNVEVTLRDQSDPSGTPPSTKESSEPAQPRRSGRRGGRPAPEPEAAPVVEAAPKAKASEQDAPEMPTGEPEPEPSVVEIHPSDFADGGRRLGPRGGSTRRRSEPDGPVLLAGQGVRRSSQTPRQEEVAQASVAASADGASRPSSGDFDAAALGLPSEPDSIVRYLTHRYRGVGEKTAESLVERFGTDLFRVLRDDPDAIAAAVTPKRAEQVLDAWRTDYERRTAREQGEGRGDRSADGGSRRGGRHRGPRGREES